MLEQQGLLLGSWQQQASGLANPVTSKCNSHFIPIFEQESGSQLGVVRLCRGPSFWPWPRRHWQVLETEDESLLLSVFASLAWLKPWEIRDSEDRLLCTVSGSYVFDSVGDPRVVLERDSVRGTNVLVDIERQQLATFTQQRDSLSLSFSPSVFEDPFAKMALLGSVLVMSGILRRLRPL